MNETTILPSRKKSPSAAMPGNGKPARKKAGYASATDSAEIRSRLILAAIVAFRDGDFSVRLPADWAGRMGGSRRLSIRPSHMRIASRRRSRG